MNKLTVKHLEKLGACSDQVELFKETFGDSVEFKSLKESKQLAKKYAQEFDFNWIGYEVFGEAYEEAIEPYYKAYQEAKEPLYKAYQEAEEPLYKAYQEAEAEIFAEMWWGK